MPREVLTVDGGGPHNASNLARKSAARVVRFRSSKRGRDAADGRSTGTRFFDRSALREDGLKVHDATCPRCDIDTKVRHRPFSDQALSALLVWNEITERVVGQAICDSCYDELREILIDRNEEINNPKPDKSETRKVTPPAATKTAASAKAAPEKAAPAAATAKKAEKTKEKEKEKTAPAKGKKVRKVS